MTDFRRYEAKAYDRYGYEIWSEVIEAQDDAAAQTEARLEYESYMLGGYEPGDYKGQMMVEAAQRFTVVRLP